MTLVRNFGGVALQALLILLGTGSILVFARDGFHVFLHDAFNWLVVLVETVVGAILDNPAIQQALTSFLGGVESWLAALGFEVDLVLQPHWKHAFVLLSLAFTAYAHAFKDFELQPATSVFRYVNAFLSAFAGGMLAGIVHLGHPDVLVGPLAAFVLFGGLNSVWRCVVLTRGAKARIAAALSTSVWLVVGGTLIATCVLADFGPTSFLPGTGPSPGLQAIAIAVAGSGLWGLTFGFGERNARQGEGPERWLANPGRRMGLRVLATLGAAAAIAGLSHVAWRTAPEASAEVAKPLVGFRDCADCPEMVTIPAGRFTMGTPETQVEQLPLLEQGVFLYERPAREIDVPSFAMASTEVTVAQFQAFTDATGYRPSGMCYDASLKSVYRRLDARLNWHHPGYEQGPDHPVVCVTWWDAQAYARWLSLKTGATYRLPSEAEWEYAARGKTTTPWIWGTDPNAGCGYANQYDAGAKPEVSGLLKSTCGDEVGAKTAPVGRYRANGFGLHDVIGNVFEWVEDCFVSDLSSSPVNSAAIRASDQVTRGDCEYRGFRGGSWHSDPGELRSAFRGPNFPPSSRSNDLGFRLARDVTPGNSPRNRPSPPLETTPLVVG